MPVFFSTSSMIHYFSGIKISVAWLDCGLVMVSLSAGGILASANTSLQQNYLVEEWLSVRLPLHQHCKVSQSCGITTACQNCNLFLSFLACQPSYAHM
jgi:hypothetical protein